MPTIFNAIETKEDYPLILSQEKIEIKGFWKINYLLFPMKVNNLFYWKYLFCPPTHRPSSLCPKMN